MNYGWPEAANDTIHGMIGMIEEEDSLDVMSTPNLVILPQTIAKLVITCFNQAELLPYLFGSFINVHYSD